MSAHRFTDRDGAPFEIVTSDSTPHVRFSFAFLYAKGGSTRMLSSSAAREVANTLVAVAHEIEVREGFAPARDPSRHDCDVCGCEIIPIAGEPRTVCADCVISGKLERDSRRLVLLALNRFIFEEGTDSADALAMTVVRDWIARRFEEDA